MNAVTLRRISIAGAILTVLLAIDGLYMVLSNYHPSDTGNNGFANIHPSDGQTVLIAALLLLIVTIVAYVLYTRAPKGSATQEQVVVKEKAPLEPEVGA
ncbi:hypothetical protein ccbrp13_48870 [Ktedonobacteria bacterium brp13]|nr:hypothetical protein ccbrp13_48870 [Ktedonobacteria bacterium brp13]